MQVKLVRIVVDFEKDGNTFIEEANFVGPMGLRNLAYYLNEKYFDAKPAEEGDLDEAPATMSEVVEKTIVAGQPENLSEVIEKTLEEEAHKIANEPVTDIVDEVAPVEEPKAEEAPKKEKKTKKALDAATEKLDAQPKKEKPSKNTKYDRTNPTHKALVRSSISPLIPKWDSPDLIQYAGNASKAMTMVKEGEEITQSGDDFLDVNGNVLDSFVDKFCRFYPAEHVRKKI